MFDDQFKTFSTIILSCLPNICTRPLILEYLSSFFSFKIIQNRLGIFRFDRLELFWYVLETAAFNNSTDHSITTKEAKQNKPPRKTI